MPPPVSTRSPYRDGSDAIRDRLAALKVRLEEVDVQLGRHRRPLPRALKNRIAILRELAEPMTVTARDMVRSERALRILEKEIDEALGLAADLQRTVNPLLPKRAVVLRWSAMTLLACGLLFGGVVHLGLGDFMLQAFGVKVMRAYATMPCERFAFEAERAANGGEDPKHDRWVDPEQ